MPITFDCPCGKALRVADEHAGRRVKCPACGVVGLVPSPEPQFEVVESPSPAPPPQSPPPATTKKSTTWDDDEDDDKRGYSVAKTRPGEDDEDEKPRAKGLPNFRQGSGRGEDDDDDDEPRPKKKKKRRSPPPERQENTGRSLEGNIVNGGVGVGCLVMIGAVVWFVIGLANDIIFFYPPVLFIVGLVAFFKGLTGQE